MEDEQDIIWLIWIERCTALHVHAKRTFLNKIVVCSRNMLSWAVVMYGSMSASWQSSSQSPHSISKWHVLIVSNLKLQFTRAFVYLMFTWHDILMMWINWGIDVDENLLQRTLRWFKQLSINSAYYQLGGGFLLIAVTYGYQWRDILSVI